MIINCLKREGNRVIVDCHSIKVYIPQIYIDQEITEIKSSTIETLGVFYFSEKSSEDSKEIFHLLKLPSNIEMEYSEVESKTLEVAGNLTKYNIFTLTKGMYLVGDENIIQSSKSASKFINLLHGGKIPNEIGYSNVIKLYLECIKLNKINLGVPYMVLESITSEICRSRKDVSIPFRFDIANPKTNTNEKDFKCVNIKEISFLSSTFAAVTFEDMNKALLYSINRS